MQNARFSRVFSIFDKIAIFSIFKRAFFLNEALVFYWKVKRAFLLKSIDSQLSLEKKIKCVAILINFLQQFEIMHKFHFSSSFFEKVENLTKMQFFCIFLENMMRTKWNFWILRFDFQKLKYIFKELQIR